MSELQYLELTIPGIYSMLLWRHYPMTFWISATCSSLALEGSSRLASRTSIGFLLVWISDEHQASTLSFVTCNKLNHLLLYLLTLLKTATKSRLVGISWEEKDRESRRFLAQSFINRIRFDDHSVRKRAQRDSPEGSSSNHDTIGLISWG